MAREFHRRSSQRRHTGFIEDLERCTECRKLKDRRIGKLPALRARKRIKIRPHKKTCCFIMPPPTSKSRQFESLRMTFMYKRPGYSARPGIEIFVTAPDRKINPPVMQFQCEIAGRVCEIESDDRSSTLPRLSYRPHIKRLAGVIIHPAHHYQRD